MTAKRLLLCFLSAIALVFAIYYGGRYSSALAERSYRRGIDQHGIIVKAMVTNKKYLKGHYVVFSYEYKKRRFYNKEQNRDYYNNLLIGEVIEIKMDSTNPGDSYIFATGYK